MPKQAARDDPEGLLLAVATDQSPLATTFVLKISQSAAT